jgi:hypothetical protein
MPRAIRLVVALATRGRRAAVHAPLSERLAAVPRSVRGREVPDGEPRQGARHGTLGAGIETEASWVVGRVVPFVGGGYRFLGSSAAIPLRDVALASGGVQVRLTDRVDGGVLVDWRQAASSQSGERLEIIPFAGWLVTDQWSVNAYASAGLADGSPDAGVGIEVAYAFTVPLGAR